MLSRTRPQIQCPITVAEVVKTFDKSTATKLLTSFATSVDETLDEFRYHHRSGSRQDFR